MLIKCYFPDFTSTSNPNVSSVNQVNTWLQDKRGYCGHGSTAFMYMFGVLMCCFTVIACIVDNKYASLDLTPYLLKWRTFLFRPSKRLLWIMKWYCFFLSLFICFCPSREVFTHMLYICKPLSRVANLSMLGDHGQCSESS